MLNSVLRPVLRPVMSGVMDVVGGGSAPPLEGYDILLPYGQSNVFYGATKDPAIDVADAKIFQWGYNAPNANTIISANDPLDYVDVSGVSGGAGNGGVGDCIGHAMTFARNTYKPTYSAGRKIMLAGYAYGGQALANGMHLSANAPGSGYSLLISRALAAQAAGADSSTFKAIIFHQGEWDYQAYGGTAQNGVVNAYRACLLYLIDKARTDLSVANLPFLIGQMTEWSIDAAGARFSTNGIKIDRIHREMVNYIGYTGFAGNGGDGTGNVHYTAAEQRALAARHATAYAAALANARPACTWPQIDLPVSDFAVSNGGMDLSGGATSAWKSTMATGGRRGELVYAEVEAAAVASQTNLGYVGLTNCFLDPSNYHSGRTGNMTAAGSNSTQKAAGVWGGQPNSVTGWTMANAVSIGTITAGTRLRIAVNGVTGKAWIGKVGSAWPNSGDPAADSNPWITGIDSRVFIAASIYAGAGNTWRLHVNAGDFSGSVPSGFVPWGSP